MKEKLIIVGVGSYAPTVADFVNRYELYDIVGFSVDNKYIIPEFMGKKVFPLERLEDYFDKQDIKLFCAISWYNSLNKYRRQKFEELKSRGFSFANLISPTACVKTEQIGEGNLIGEYALIGYDCQIGDNNVFGTQTIVGHHTIVGNHNALAGRTTLGGDSIIGDQNYFGLSCVVFNRIEVGNQCIIGGGSVVKRSLQDYSLVSSPDSRCKKGSKKTNEFIMSPKGTEILKQLDGE